MSAVTDFSFEDLEALCPGTDLTPYRDRFDVMFDINGVLLSHTIGFHFDFDEDDASREAEFLALVELFHPVVLWAGSPTVLEKVQSHGYSGLLFPYFQEGGFMVILKIPAPVQ